MAFTPTTDSVVRDNVMTLAASSYIKERMFDQVTRASCLLSWMAGRDRVDIAENQLMAEIPPETMEQETALVPMSGNRIEILLEMESNDSVKWISPWEAVDTENQQLYTRAYFDWKHLAGDVVLSEIEEGMTDSSAIIDKMFAAQLKSLKKAMVANLQAIVCQNGTANGGKAAGGLQLWVADDPATGTVGGINRALNTAWRNQQVALSATLTDLKKMRVMYHDCSLGNSVDHPTFIITTQNIFEQYQALLTTTERNEQNKRLGNLDFEHYLFANRCIVSWDGNIPANHMYFLSKQGWKWAFNPALNFKFRGFAYKPGAFVKESPVVFTNEFIAVEPRRLGVITAITNV